MCVGGSFVGVVTVTVAAVGVVVVWRFRAALVLTLFERLAERERLRVAADDWLCPRA